MHTSIRNEMLFMLKFFIMHKSVSISIRHNLSLLYRFSDEFNYEFSGRNKWLLLHKLLGSKYLFICIFHQMDGYRFEYSTRRRQLMQNKGQNNVRCELNQILQN